METETKALAKTLSPKQLAKLSQDTYRKHAPALLDAFYAKLLEGINRGDEKMLSLGAKVLKLAQSDGVQVNVQQNNVQIAGSSRDRTAEAIIRRLEQRKFAQKQAETAIDAEFSESDAG